MNEILSRIAVDPQFRTNIWRAAWSSSAGFS
jgi:hypothetical protein